MTVQIPLKQDKKRMTRGGGGSSFAYSANYDLMSLALDDDMDECMMLDDDMDEGVESESAPKNTGKFRSMRKNRKKTVKQIGSANAARVSRGSEVDTWKGLT